MYLSQDFETPFTGTPAAPPGWTQSRFVMLGTGTPSANGVNGEKDWQQNFNTGASTWTFNGYSSTRPAAAVSGTGVLFLEDGYFGSTATWFGSRRIESPAVNLTSSTSPYVRFWLWYLAASSNLNLRVMASADGGTTWNSIMVIPPNATATTTSSATPWQRINVLIPTAYRTANAKFGIEATNTWGTNDIWIDDFSVEEFTPTTITSAASGNWSAAATWVGGIVPSADNHVVIASGHTVNADVNIARAQNITINGTLAYAGTSPSQLIHAFGDVTVNSGGTLNSFSGTTGKSVYFGGNFTNNGTANFSVGAGNIVWLGGAPASLSGSGTFTNGRSSNAWHLNSGGVTYNVPITITGTIGLYNGVVNPNGNLTAGNSTVATTQTIDRSSLGSFSAQPIWGTGVNRSVTYSTNNYHPASKQLFSSGHEIRQVDGIGYVEGTLTMNAHDNVQLSNPVVLGTATLGTLTLTRGILVTTDANLLTLSTFVAGPTGIAQTIATAPATHITNHGSYIAGPLRINFPTTGTASRNFPLGVGTGFAGPSRNENNLKTMSFGSSTAWTGSTVKVSLVGPLSGTANSPLTQVITTRGWYVDLLGGPDLPANTTVTLRGRNNTGGNSDNLVGDQSELRIAQATAITGPWNNRSNASGTGPILDNTEYSRTTSVAAPGPIAPIGTQGAYFGFATTMTAANPTGVTAVADGQNKIDINFVPNAANNPVVIVFNTTGTFTDPTGAPPAVGQSFAGGTLIYNGLSSPFSHTGLTAATTYYYKLFSYSAPMYSSGVTANATTACPVYTTFPVTESFEAVTFPPVCWNVAQVSGTGLWEGTASGSNPTTTPQQGTRMAQFRSYNFSSGASSILVSPAINFPNANYRVNFWMNRDNGYLTNADRVVVHYNTSPNLTGATELGTVHRSINLAPVVSTGGWYNYIFNLPTGSSGTGYIIFQAISAYGNNIFLDNAKIEVIPPPCIVPSAQPTALNLTATSTSVNGTFTASPTANGYLVVRHTSATLGGAPVNNTVYAAGAALGDGTVVYNGPLTEFSSTSLNSSTQYFFFVFAYNLSETCTGPVYRTASPLTANITTGPAAPATFTATPTSSTAIAFTATPNAQNHNIIVAWNTSNTFGTPTGTLTPGSTIPGGGTVHYVGAASGLFPHTGLKPATQYFYRAWSVVAGPVYSTTFVNATATTLFGTPFTQNFDASPTGTTLPPGWSSYASTTGTDARPWTISNNTTIGNVSAPNFVGVFYHASLAKNEWMVTPGIQLTAGQPYLVRFYVRAPGYLGIPEKMKVTVAGTNTLAGISAGTVIWDNPNMLIASYQEQVINFTPTTTGPHYFGWHAYSVADVDFIAVDNIRIEEQPAFQFTPEEANFRDIYAGMQSAPTQFTLKNNRTTPITVSGVNIIGTHADQFVKQDGNTYPLTIPANGTATVNVIFKPTSTGQKNAQLQVVENNGTWTAALTGRGYVHSPQNLTANPVAPTHVQLNWEAPIFPANEIRYDDNSVETWLLVASPTATTHLISQRITIPQNGQLTHLSVLSRIDAAGSVNWENIMLCSETGGNPNLATPIQTFSNVPVTSTTGQWNVFQLTTPLNVTAGQNYYIVAQWPAASSTGPRVGNDAGFGFGRSRWSNDGGTTWNNWTGNFFMRAYMNLSSKGELVLKSGEENPAMKYLPVQSIMERASVEKSLFADVSGIEAPAIIATGEATEGKNPTGYVVYRGTTSGNYDTQFNVSGTSYLDQSTAGASSYFYAVAAVYPQGQGLSNEVNVNTLCTTLPIPYVQNFDVATFPTCWTQTISGALPSNRWTVANASNAGGTPYEMRASYVNNIGISRLISPALNTQGESQLTLRFRSRIDDYGPGATFKIQTSSDGINWTDEQWSFATQSNTTYPPEIITTTLLNNIGSTTYVAWVIDGNHFQFDYWDIDEVLIAAGMSVTAVPQNLSCFGSNDGSITLNVLGGLPPYTYLWLGPNGYTSTDQNISGLAAGVYNYTVFDANNVQVSNSVTLTQPDAIPAPTLSNITTVYDGMEHTITAVPATGTELVWYDAATGGNVTTAPSATNAGIYTAWAVSKNTTNGCESARVQATLTINKKQLTVTADNQTVCQNQPLPTLTFSYSGFITGEGPENLDAPVVISTTAQAGGAAGTYPITVSGGASNNYSFTYVNATLTMISSPTVNAGGNGSVCVSESFPLVAATASNYATVLWTTSGNGTFSNTGIVNPVYTPGSQDIANGSVVLTITGDPGSQCAMSSSMTLTLQNDLPVSVTITQVTPEICIGSPATFQAVPVNGGLAPSYQWKVNGVNAGTNSASFTYVPANGDVVTVVLTSSIGCALNNPATSNPLVVNVTGNLIAGVSITSSATSVCTGTPVTFTASPVNGGQNPSYQWKVNGNNAGTNSPTFTYSPANGDVVTVVMTSNHLCAVQPIATSNAITMVVNPPLLELAASPTRGGTVSGGGNFAFGTQVPVVATPAPGWEFVNWKNKNGVVVSTNPTFSFTITECYELLTATFSSTAKIAGQIKYFNPNETVIPSPNSRSVFYVQLFEGGQPVSERQLVSYNFENNLDSYFEFIGAESAKTYTLRFWEQANQNFLNTSWMWNNWGGLSSIDALLLGYMGAGNPLLTTLPWIAPVSVPNYTALFSQAADLNNSGDLTGLDGLLLQYRIVNDPAYHPLPGGKHDFQLATVRLENHAAKSYPQAPTSVFTPHGVYQAGSLATSVYYDGVLTGLEDGLNVFNIYLVTTGDLNASHMPSANSKSTSSLAYQGVINAAKGDELVIPVLADRNLSLGAAGLGLKYNKQLIEVISAEGFPVHYIDSKAGEVRMSKVDVNGFNISQGQAIATLKVKLLADISAGTSFFELLPMTEFVSPNLNVEALTLKTNYIETGSGSGEISASLLHTIFPNPANNTATLQYTLPVDSKVKVVVYNSLGQEVSTLLDASQQAGTQQLTISRTDLQGSGSYFYRIIAEGAQRTYTVRGTFVITR
ncbi:MAG TPA: MBG domain-containing protein [Bacteroidales bacterium]|nr:MBG domain-containing protein [Bacteroidales bacterium]